MLVENNADKENWILENVEKVQKQIKFIETTPIVSLEQKDNLWTKISKKMMECHKKL